MADFLFCLFTASGAQCDHNRRKQGHKQEQSSCQKPHHERGQDNSWNERYQTQGKGKSLRSGHMAELVIASAKCEIAELLYMAQIAE